MKAKTKMVLISLSLLVLILVILGIFYIIYLNKAHSTFENYYHFRGCKELVNKTADDGYCRLASGEIIKIVKYQDKWYLDGDLPVSCGIINCP